MNNDKDARRFLGAFKDQPTQPDPPSFLVPPKCEACKDTGEVEARFAAPKDGSGRLSLTQEGEQLVNS